MSKGGCLPSTLQCMSTEAGEQGWVQKGHTFPEKKLLRNMDLNLFIRENGVC